MFGGAHVFLVPYGELAFGFADFGAGRGFLDGASHSLTDPSHGTSALFRPRSMLPVAPDGLVAFAMIGARSLSSALVRRLRQTHGLPLEALRDLENSAPVRCCRPIAPILFFAMPRGVYSQLFIGPSSFVSLLYHSHTHFSRWQNHRSSRRFFGQGAENCNFSRFSLYKSEALCYTEYVVRLKEADFFFFCGKNRPPSCKGRKNMLY